MSTGIADIRAQFLDYFAGHGHTKIASSPLVPLNDPTLLFARREFAKMRARWGQTQ